MTAVDLLEDDDGAPFPAEVQEAYKTAVASLVADAAEDEALRERMADLLTRTAAALKGDPPPLTSHDWSDLPEWAAAAEERLQLARAALIGTGYFTPDEVGRDVAPRITELWSALHPPEEHVMEVREGNDYGLQHPLACRPDLLDCPVNVAARALDGPPAPPGRYVVDVDDDGELNVIDEAS